MSKAEHYANLHAAVARYVPAAGRAQMEQFLRTILSNESEGKSHAKNERSSATGLFQFTKATWAAYGKGQSIYDSNAQCDAVVRLALENAQEIKSALHLNRELTAGEYYLGHFAGSSGAINVLTANADKPLSQILSDSAMLANAPTKFRGKKFAEFTAGDLRDWANTKMNVDMDAREEYQQRRVSHTNSAEDDTRELAERKRILVEFGMDKKLADALPLDDIFGKFFFGLLKMFMDDAATPAERLARESRTEAPVEPTQQTNLPAKKQSQSHDVPVGTR